jgi:GntR family transcriptional regulator
MQHPYERIAEHYRQKIRDGDLTPGQRLPNVKDIAEEHGRSSTTVRHALSWLQVEGYIVTTQRGSFVADNPNAGASARDRLLRTYRTGSFLAVGETKRVAAAELIVPPLYVAELFDIDPGERLVRREYVTGRGHQRTMLAVDWYPADFAAAVPDLLGTEPGQRTAGHPGRGNDLLMQIEKKLGRRVTSGRDAMHGRDADAREAAHLGVAVGSPILAGAHEWSDEQGLIVYGEWCLPYRFTIGYEYTVE